MIATKNSHKTRLGMYKRNKLTCLELNQDRKASHNLRDVGIEHSFLTQDNKPESYFNCINDEYPTATVFPLNYDKICTNFEAMWLHILPSPTLLYTPQYLFSIQDITLL